MTAFQQTLHARLRLAAEPQAVFDALTDIGPMHRWFLRHAGSLGAVEPAGAYPLRGDYHFWSHFAPDPPPALMTTLTALHLPDAADPCVRMRYTWNHRGNVTELELELTPRDGGSLLHLAHFDLSPLADDPLGGAAYWTVVLENMRLYLLGHDGLAYHCARRTGELELALTLSTPGLDATATAWEMLTTPSALDRLWGDGARVDGRVGGELSYGWERGGPGEITAYEPPHSGVQGINSARLASV